MLKYQTSKYLHILILNSFCLVFPISRGHPKVCKRLPFEKYCKFGDDCAFHIGDQDQKQLSVKNEFEINIQKDEVKDVKIENKKILQP